MIAILAALAAPPCPPEFQIDAIVSRVESEGGAMLDLVAIPGVNVDQVLVIVVNGGVGFIPFKDSCAVGPPVKYDEANKAVTPA